MTDSAVACTKLFEFPSYPEYVLSTDSTSKVWRLRVYRKDFPDNAYPTSNGLITIPDSEDVLYYFKQLSKDGLIPAKYYKCSYVVSDSCIEFTSLTEKGLRLGFFEFLKLQFKNFRTTMTYQWYFKGFEDPQSESDFLVQD